MTIKKYLDRYAEPEISTCRSFPNNARFKHVLVIPACRETASFIQTLLQSQDAHKNFLLILVINQSDSASPETAKANDTLFHYINSQFETVWQHEKLRLSNIPDSSNAILTVDRFSQNNQIPSKQGVGLARKIGADIAVCLQEKGIIASEWIFNTDADVLLPSNYFDREHTLTSAGIIFPFQHERCAGDSTDSAMLLYEISLRYYVYSLQQAKSRYAHHSLGSTIAIRMLEYTQARGFPKRAAGEDFYLLNKLNKLGTVTQLSSPIITINNRSSDRVPFGTGPAIKRINELPNQIDSYLLYHPQIFEHLKTFLMIIPTLYDYKATWNSGGLDSIVNETITDSQHHWQSIILPCLNSLNFNEALAHAFNQSRQPQQFIQHIDTWFDGFRTLKFVHYLREHHLPSVPIDQIISAHPQFLAQASSTPNDRDNPINSLIDFNRWLFHATHHATP